MEIVENKLQNLQKVKHIKSIYVKSINITIYSGEDFAFLKTIPGKLKYVEESAVIELDENNDIGRQKSE
jgi:thiamine monophosphate kinase